MQEFARHEFGLLERQKDGKTLREHLEAAQRFTKKVPGQLIGPELPDECTHWWEWWSELNSCRQCGMSANPISWSDIYSWSQLTKTTIDKWDAKAIRAIDAEFMAVAAKQNASK